MVDADADASVSSRPLPFFLAFAALAIGWTWPVAAHLSSRIPHDPGDPILNTWILWWNAQAIPFTAGWWNPPILVPMHGALALSEHLAGLGVLATPLQLAGASPLTAYNVCLIASYALSGWFAYLLTHRLTGSIGASVCAGVAFATAPYRAGQLAHLQVLTSQWMPSMLLGLHAYVSSGQKRWLALFAAAWLLQATSNGYFLLFLPVLILMWVGWFVDWRRAPARGWAALGTWAGSSLLLVPVLLEYRSVHTSLGLTRQPDEMARFSARASSFFHAAPLLRFWPTGTVPTQEDYLFPGVTAVLLVVAVAVAIRKGARTSGATATSRSAFVFYASAAVVMYAFAFGPGVAADPWSWLRPYRWLSFLPGYDGLRVPARFAMLGVLCLSVSTGVAVSLIARWLPVARGLVVAVLAGLVVDGSMHSVPLGTPPPRAIIPDSGDAVVLELPADDGRVNLGAMYRAIGHGRPIVNGYSGYTPPHYAILGIALRRGDTSPLESLTRSRPLIVVVNGQFDAGGDFRRIMTAMPGVEPLGASSAGETFRLPRRNDQRPAIDGTPIGTETHDEGGERLSVDLGSPHVIRGVVFNLRWHYQELAERLLIERSDDGKSWQQAWLGWTGGPAFEAAIEDPLLAPVRIPLPAVRARYLRIYPAPRWLGREVCVLGE